MVYILVERMVAKKVALTVDLMVAEQVAWKVEMRAFD